MWGAKNAEFAEIVHKNGHKTFEEWMLKSGVGTAYIQVRNIVISIINVQPTYNQTNTSYIYNIYSIFNIIYIMSIGIIYIYTLRYRYF